MNVTAIIRRIRGVAFALDKVEVRGRENLDIVLGSIQELERAAAKLEESLKEMEPKDDEEPEIGIKIVQKPEAEGESE